MKEKGGTNDLIDRLQADPVFAGVDFAPVVNDLARSRHLFETVATADRVMAASSERISLVALGRGWWVGWSRGPAFFSFLNSSSNDRPCSRWAKASLHRTACDPAGALTQKVRFR